MKYTIFKVFEQKHLTLVNNGASRRHGLSNENPIARHGLPSYALFSRETLQAPQTTQAIALTLGSPL